jgi:putative sterol carrier protein
VPLFSSEADVYAHLGRLFEEMVADPELAQQFQRADTVVQYRYRDPEATITVDIRQDAEPRVELGTTELEPEVVMSMEADTAHRFFLGDVNVTVALARGQIKAKGPVAKILKLVPLVKPVFSRYESQLIAEGRTDLVKRPKRES